MRERLIELLNDYSVDCDLGEWEKQDLANYLVNSGVIVPPCKAGDKAYHLTSIDTLDELNAVEIFEGKVSTVSIEDKVWIYCRYDNGLNFWYTELDVGEKLFFTREEAEKALVERSKE